MTGWFVAFPTREPEARGLWRLFTAPGYRHVMACRAAGPEATLVLNPLARRLEVGVQHWPVERYLAALIQRRSMWVLALPPGWRERDGVRMAVRGPLTCVEVVKAALGITAWWVLTPRQLARYLKRRGAVPVLPA